MAITWEKILQPIKYTFWEKRFCNLKTLNSTFYTNNILEKAWTDEWDYMPQFLKKLKLYTKLVSQTVCKVLTSKFV